MMDPNLSATIQAIASIAQAFIGCVGVPALLVSLYFVWRQARDQTLATRATVYQNITATMLDIDRFFIDQPELKKYFYDDEKLAKKNVDYPRVQSIAEMILDFADFTLEHKPHMKDYPWHQWEKYFKYVYDHSPVMRDYWEEVKDMDWYDKELEELFGGKVDASR